MESFGSLGCVQRFMKGAFETNPTLPFESKIDTWDPQRVLDFLEPRFPCDTLTLKELTLKLTFFLDRVGYSGAWLLTDSDDTTCTTLPVTVTLDTPIPLTWIRVVVRDAGDLNQIQLSYQLSGTSTPLACPGLRKAKVDDLTLDIECSTTQKVSGVTLSGSGVTGLCSLYISGGRNVALKQSALQSSRYNPRNNQIDWLASHAVDGTTGGGNDRSTCTHTLPNTASPGWWTVTFSQAADVTRFLIFNRGDSRIKQT
ncbi:hypothetical protein RRG08_029092 [Elysia crispata]|uniref:Fucolectin tachylectin-4 pentraxin-1 domain-containing protein n=1 Tax=Elysia crispata TaxID=231223 RepID=A0AAE1D3V5_9GAST|nr:hypothetical protein RRG08_029092 [Elysia crispata]